MRIREIIVSQDKYELEMYAEIGLGLIDQIISLHNEIARESADFSIPPLNIVGYNNDTRRDTIEILRYLRKSISTLYNLPDTTQSIMIIDSLLDYFTKNN